MMLDSWSLRKLWDGNGSSVHEHATAFKLLVKQAFIKIKRKHYEIQNSSCQERNKSNAGL